MKKVLPEGSRKDFPMPPGIVFSRIDTKTGMLATRSSKKTRLECFTEGTEPREFSPEERDQDEADFFKEEFDPLESPPAAAEVGSETP